MKDVVKKLKAYFDLYVSTNIDFWMRHAHHIRVVEVPNKTLIKQAETREFELRFILEGAAAILIERAVDKEMCIDLCFEGQFLCDFKSLGTGKPSKVYIRNFEEITMAVIGTDAITEILGSSVEAHYLSRILIQQQNIRGQTYIENLGKNSLERYRALADQYRGNFNRIPLHLVASYLGVTPEWVSRIRSKHP